MCKCRINNNATFSRNEKKSAAPQTEIMRNSKCGFICIVLSFSICSRWKFIWNFSSVHVLTTPKSEAKEMKICEKKKLQIVFVFGVYKSHQLQMWSNGKRVARNFVQSFNDFYDHFDGWMDAKTQTQQNKKEKKKQNRSCQHSSSSFVAFIRFSDRTRHNHRIDSSDEMQTKKCRKKKT